MLNSKSYIIFLIVLFPLVSFAQFDPNPELEWQTIETQHFYIHYHNGTERTANVVAKIAEEIYGPITKLYKYEPSDKTSLIINDESDYSNGATDYFGNRIEIASANLDFDMRGTHNWLRNVITHEFAHVIQVPAAFKFGSKLPAIYLQYLGYEDERRPDVLYGYPNTIVSYPLSGVSVPAWFAEGTAQYQRQQLGYEYWDAHRDMIVRMRALDNKLLTWQQMGQFASSTTYQAESIYNSGFNLVRYISDTYGEDKLQQLTDHMGDVLTYDVESSFKKSVGKSGESVYNEWRAHLKKDYAERTSRIKDALAEGEKISSVGFMNLHPKYSPDGKKIAYLSNKTYDYGSTSLFIRNGESKDDEKFIAPSVSGGFNWSPDGKKIIYARKNTPTIHDKAIFDLYEYHIASEKETQITFSKRAHSPAYSPDGKYISFVTNSDGTQNLWVADNENGNKITVTRKVTDNKNGEQVYSPVWANDSKTIYYSASKHDARSIAKVDITTNLVEPLFEHKDSDYRNVTVSPDGMYLYFASDLTGIFNIYRYDIRESVDTTVERFHQVTNVLGGAFMPNVNGKHELIFSNWTSDGYKINRITDTKDLFPLITEKNANYVRPEKVLSKYAKDSTANPTIAKDNFDWPKLKNYDDDNLKKKNSTRYTNVATPLFIIPVLRFDAYNKSKKFVDYIKPGVYFYSQDVLGKMGIFGGASINRLLERDVFLQFDYNNGVPFFKDFFNKKLGFVPSFQFAGYNVTRKTDAELLAGLDTIPIELTYDLLQFDFNMAFKIINANHKMNAGFSYSHYNYKLGTFQIPATQFQVPASSTNYFNGRDLSLTYTFRDFSPSKNDDISPIGRYFRLKYDYEINDLNPQLEIDENTGQTITIFNRAKFHRLEGDLANNFEMFGGHSLGFRLRGGSIFGPRQDNFFDFYASGFPGMKGYPFYAIGGPRYFTANLTYRFPLATGLDFRILQFYFDKIYLSFYGDIGNAWEGKNTKLKDFKKDVGAELRIQAFSNYVYPTAFAFNAAYGLDQFMRNFPTTTNERRDVTYGKEWRYYFTMLFGFDFFIENDGDKFSRFKALGF